MSEGAGLFIVIVGFIFAGMALNYLGESLYWWWADWKARRKKND